MLCARGHNALLAPAGGGVVSASGPGGGGGGGGGVVLSASMGGDHCQNSHPLFNYQGGGGGGGGVLCNVTDCGKASPSSIPYQSQSHAIPLETNPVPLWAYKQMAS